MVMTAIGLPLLCVFISEFLFAAPALSKPTPCGRRGARWESYSMLATCFGLYQRMFFGTMITEERKAGRLKHARMLYRRRW